MSESTAPEYSEPRRPWLRTLSVAFITTIFGILLFVGVLQIAYGGQARRQQATQEQIVSLQKAIGCELGVPVSNGARDPVLLASCWTNEGLTPPTFLQEQP